MDNPGSGSSRPEAAREPVIVYPADDAGFADAVAAAVAPLRPPFVEDPRLVAATEALLRVSYPLANIQIRVRPIEAGTAWDVFRDPAVLDDELVVRTREGDRDALSELYDRHHRLAYTVALAARGRAPAAENAVVTAFRSLIADPSDATPVRVRLAAMAYRHVTGDLEQGSEAVVLPRLADLALQLVLAHRLSSHEIAAILGIERGDVARLVGQAMTSGR
jgi:hypothetical protein